MIEKLQILGYIWPQSIMGYEQDLGLQTDIFNMSNKVTFLTNNLHV